MGTKTIHVTHIVGGDITVTTGGSLDNTKTRITFTDETSQEYDWSGTISEQTMIEAGLLDENTGEWVKDITSLEIGTNVTGID